LVRSMMKLYSWTRNE
jgi:hypothetical protein